MSLVDLRLDYISHFGTKGMKWGVRKAVYKRQKKHAVSARASAKDARKMAGDIKSGKTKSNASMVKVLTRFANEADGVDDKSAKEMRQTIKDIESGKRVSTHQKKKIKALQDGAKRSEAEAKSWDKAAKKNKTKIDALSVELAMDKTKRDAKREAHTARNGKEFVSLFFTGNKEGRITKGAIAQYAVAAGVVGLMVAKK